MTQTTLVKLPIYAEVLSPQLIADTPTALYFPQIAPWEIPMIKNLENLVVTYQVIGITNLGYGNTSLRKKIIRG